MEVMIRKMLDKVTSQLLFGELEVEVKATVKNAEEITRRTSGKVFITAEKGDVLDFETGNYEVYSVIVNELKKAILNKVKEQKVKEVELDIDELDWNKIYEVIQKLEEKEQKKKEQKEKEKRAEQKLSSFVARFNSEHKEIQTTSIARMYGKTQIRIGGYGVSISEYFDVEEILSDNFTYEHFSAVVHEKVIEHFKKLAEIEKEEIDKLKQENALLREFIAEHHTANELAEWLVAKKKQELYEEAWDEAENLVPELFEEDEEDYY